MPSATRVPRLLVAIVSLLVAVVAAAQGEVRIGQPSNVDLHYMTQQRDSLQNLAATHLGRRFSGDRTNDLQILQLLLDRRLVKAHQTRELQAMGIIMGDLLAVDLDMHWVIYEDVRGRSRALRYQESSEFLFPVTMISRRREADNHTPVADIYRKAYDIIAPLKPEIPFQ